MMVEASAFLLVGFLGLVIGAEWLVSGSLGIARFFKLSPIWVGTVLVGIATTIPEMLVSLVAVVQGHIGISLGNALGSYVANIGLVLGLTACYKPLKVNANLFQRELPLLSAAYVVLCVLLFDQFLSRTDGVLLLLALALFLWFVSRFLTKPQQDLKSLNIDEPKKVTVSKNDLLKSIAWFVLGLVVLWLSAKSMVIGAKSVAVYFGLSDMVIGLTVVAVGTSLPELATSIISVRKGHHDLALGNVLGSNIFGILGVVAIPGLIAPGKISSMIITRDLTTMGVMTIALWLVAYSRDIPKATIKRWEGVILFSLFCGYMLMTLL